MVKVSWSSSSEEEEEVKLKKIDIHTALTIAGIKDAEQTKQNAENSQADPLVNRAVLEEEEATEATEMRSTSSKRRNLDADEFEGTSKPPGIQVEESSEISRKSGFGHGKNHSGSLKDHTVSVLDDENEEEEKGSKKMSSKRRNLDGEITESSKKMPKIGFGHGKNRGASLEKNTILDDEDEDEGKGSKKMRSASSKRRNLDGKSPKPRIGYSIDGKKLPKPKFGYSIDGKKLPRMPTIQNLEAIIGTCSDPFEKKLLKADFDRLAFHSYDVKRAILPLMKDDEIDDLAEGIRVNTYDEFGNCYEMIFDTYRYAFYKLCNGWEKLLKEHKVKENEDCYVAVWVFRHVETDGLCFALILKK